MTKRGDFFNSRPYTVSHCNCDDIFHRCLKSAGTKAAWQVGALFFNYRGVKCFRTRPKKTCVKWYIKDLWCKEYSESIGVVLENAQWF